MYIMIYKHVQEALMSQQQQGNECIIVIIKVFFVFFPMLF